MAHDHSHAADIREESKSKMLLILGLTSTFMVVEVVAGLYTKSLALLADAGHMLTDVAALSLGLVAVWFASRPPTAEHTYGYYRTEILAGLINSVLLVGISGFVLYEAYRRLGEPPEVTPVPMLIVASIGLCINLLSMKLLGRLADKSINVKAAYLEVMSDMFATVGVIIAALIILFTRWYAVDAIISAGIGLFILPRTWVLLRECVNVLMEGTPGHINLGELRRSMLAVPGVADVHDIHCWTITSGMDSLSCHVTIDISSSADQVLAKITKIAQDDFGLHHTTIQVEQVECKGQGGEKTCGPAGT
jgi:cobalt-zinc-cadmium efflux system protein